MLNFLCHQVLVTHEDFCENVNDINWGWTCLRSIPLFVHTWNDFHITSISLRVLFNSDMKIPFADRVRFSLSLWWDITLNEMYCRISNVCQTTKHNRIHLKLEWTYSWVLKIEKTMLCMNNLKINVTLWWSFSIWVNVNKADKFARNHQVVRKINENTVKRWTLNLFCCFPHFYSPSWTLLSLTSPESKPRSK